MVTCYLGRLCRSSGYTGVIVMQSEEMELDLGKWLGNRRTHLVHVCRSSMISFADYLEIFFVII